MRIIGKVIVVMLVIACGLVGFDKWQKAQDARRALVDAELHIAQAIENGRLSVDLSDFPSLRVFPSGLAGMEGLARVNINGTDISDLGPLANHSEIEYFTMRDTLVVDLSPLATIARLTNLNIGGSLIEDLSPLTQLPNLQRLDIGTTQIASLEPATRIPSLRWINLHAAYAIDGSQQHYETLLDNVPEVYNGRPFQVNYQPADQYLLKVRLRRFWDQHAPRWLDQ